MKDGDNEEGDEDDEEGDEDDEEDGDEEEEVNENDDAAFAAAINADQNGNDVDLTEFCNQEKKNCSCLIFQFVF